MKKIYLLLVIGLLSVNVFSQAPSWVWAASNNNGSGYANSVTTDVSGNIYIAGNCNSSGIAFGSDYISCTGPSKMFLAKFNNLGNPIWARAGIANISSTWDAANSVTTDASANSYVVGYYYGHTFTFGTFVLTNPNADNVPNMYIAKYSPTGVPLWAKNANGNSASLATSVASDGFGNIYVGGRFFGTSFTLETTTLNNADNTGSTSDIFLAKYDTSGTLLWAKRAGGTNNEQLNSVTCDVFGNSYLIGDFNSATMFFGATTLTNVDNSGTTTDMYFAKYDSIGTVLFAKKTGGVYNETGKSVTTDISGNSYITGYFFSPSITFGTNTIINADNSGSTSDIYIAKYSPNGSALLANDIGGTNYEISNSITCNSTNIYITGWFRTPNVVFGSTTLTNVDLAGNFNDIFVAKYDTSFIEQWAVSAGSSSSESGNSITTNLAGNCIVAGDFTSPSINFGSTTLTSFSDEVFVAELGLFSGIQDFFIKDNLSISPNPFSTSTTITFSEAGKHNIKIMDVLGNEIRNYQSGIRNEKSIIVDMTSFAKGIYFVQLMDEAKNVLTKKLVVE